MTLYELSAQAQELYDALLDSDLNDEEREQIVADTMLGMDANEKLESYCKIVRIYETDAKACADEIKRLTEAKKNREKAIANLKSRMLDYVLASGSQRPIEAGIFRISKRRSEKVDILDADKIPDDLCRISREPDREKIGIALKGGADLGGYAVIKENFSLTIK